MAPTTQAAVLDHGPIGPVPVGTPQGTRDRRPRPAPQGRAPETGASVNAKTWQEHGKSMARAWQKHGKSMAKNMDNDAQLDLVATVMRLFEGDFALHCEAQ